MCNQPSYSCIRTEIVTIKLRTAPLSPRRRLSLQAKAPNCHVEWFHCRVIILIFGVDKCWLPRSHFSHATDSFRWVAVIYCIRFPIQIHFPIPPFIYLLFFELFFFIYFLFTCSCVVAKIKGEVFNAHSIFCIVLHISSECVFWSHTHSMVVSPLLL